MSPHPGDGATELRRGVPPATGYLARIGELDARYRAGQVRVNVPAGLLEAGVELEADVAACLPESRRLLEGAANGLFLSLPVAFDPAWSVGPYLATVDRDGAGEPYRFLDLGAMIASQPFGENDPAVAATVVEALPFAVGRYAHSEYQTSLSLRFKEALDGIAPAGTPRHFVVNTGAEAVENAIKALLLNRVKTLAPGGTGGDPVRTPADLFVVSFEGGYHGRTLGSLAVTQRRRARLGFPTFEWPHVAFPVEDPRSESRTARRDEKSLEQLWSLLVGGRAPGATRARSEFQALLAACDAFLAALPADRTTWLARTEAFVEERRRAVDPAALARARRAAGVLVEPIQGEGGLRMASASFFRRLRLLTRIHDVPLVFDEVQTGWGATGLLWAHQGFDLPCPPDAVVWAKKAQNGVLFVSEELAAFFQEEKKFNTTWEGEPVGMARVMAWLGRLDLDQVNRTGSLARASLERVARDHRGLLQNVRGKGCLLAVDVARPDLREWLRERAFRRGLILLPAGERTLRLYPRYDMEPSAMEEAFALLRSAVEDLASGKRDVPARRGPEVRTGSVEVAPAALAEEDLAGPARESLVAEVAAVEAECYGNPLAYPSNVLRSGRRPLLQFAGETLAATLATPRAAGVGLRDRVSGRIVGYALGSPLEGHDELGVRDDPRHGENDAFYLQAMAVSPRVRNRGEVERIVLDALRRRVAALGFAWISSLIEERVVVAGPGWLRNATVQETVDDYLLSGIRFAYVRAAIA